MDTTVHTHSQDIPPELITQLAKTVSKTARRYEMMGRPGRAVRLLESALENGEPDLRPQDKALLMADLGDMLWKQGCYKDALPLLEEARQLAEGDGE